MSGRAYILKGTVVLLTMVWLLSACRPRTVYYQYKHTQPSGWEKNDTLSFVIGPITASDNYKQEIGLRINGAYPFMSLQLIVEQQLLTSGKLRADTLTCSLIDLQGTPLGDGVSHYQYLLPLNSLMLHQKERLRVAIRHNMKREILPGITDVGIRLTRAH